jgi:hypothetical protein
MKTILVAMACVAGCVLVFGCGGADSTGSRVGVSNSSANARSGVGDTRIGTIELEGGYATEATTAKLRDELKFQAAVQTYLWSFPLANVMRLREGHREVGITSTSIPIFEDYLTPKTLVPTGNQSTVYAHNVLTLGAEPMVLEVIPDVVGFIGDAWQRPQGDLGRPGPDKGKGGKFLLVPPGYEGDLPESGYYMVPCATYNVFWLVRAFLKDGDNKAAAKSLRDMKLYPLSNPDAPQTYINASEHPARCIPPHGLGYWELIAKGLNEETVQVHDRAMMGMASILGIEKGKPFEPDEKMRALLIEAEEVAFAMNTTLSFESEVEGALAYDDRQWEFCFLTDSPSFDDEHHLELYERSAFTHQAMTGAFAMVLSLRGKGSKYIVTSRDATGAHLDGSDSYTLNIPANVPAKDFWSVCVYDVKTRSILDTGRPKSAVNSYTDLPVNEDGSVDLYFGPNPPDSGETGWIKTKPGEGFFMYFRFYGPLEPFYDKSWKLNDVVKVG